MRFGAISAWGSTTSPSTGSVSFTVPGSDLYTSSDLFHSRRALTGGTLSRAWLGFDQGGTTYVFSYDHNGSNANPVDYVPSLSGATHAFVSIGSSSQTSAQAAAALIAVATGSGVTGIATDGTDVNGNTIITVSAGSNLLIPESVDTADTALRGMWGAQRDDWGSTITENQNGGTGGTGTVYINNPGAALSRSGRILGAYLWGHTSFAPRVAVSSGSGYTPSPTSFDILAESLMDPVSGFGSVIFSNPPTFSPTDTLWFHFRDNVAGGPRYRNHGETIVGTGSLQSGQALIWDTTTTDSATPFGATYSPTINTTFNIYMMVGIIFELQDENGNYPADGSINVLIGDQNRSIHGAYTEVSSSFLNGETTHHRFYIPEWTDYGVTEVSRGVIDIGADEDSEFVFYQWSDLTVPSTGSHNRLAAGQTVGISTADAINVRSIGTRIELGTETLGTSPIVSLGFNYVRSGGLENNVYVLPAFIDEFIGNGGYLTCWHDDRENWHDWIPGASGDRAPTSAVIEYRTRTNLMPTGSQGDPWPDPFGVDPTDDSPIAIAIDSYRVQRNGISSSN